MPHRTFKPPKPPGGGISDDVFFDLLTSEPAESAAEPAADPPQRRPNLSSVAPQPSKVIVDAFKAATTSNNTHPLTLAPEPPADIDPKVKRFRAEIYRKIVSGWHPEAIATHLERTKGIVISPDAILDYRDAIPTESFLPVPRIHQKTAYPVEVDPMQEIHYLLASMRERYSAASFLEEIEGRPLSSTTDLAEVYFEMLSATVKLQQAQGDLPNLQATPTLPEGLKPLTELKAQGKLIAPANAASAADATSATNDD